MLDLLFRVIPLGIGAALTPSLFGLQILTTAGTPWRARATAVVVGAASAFAIACTLLLLGFAQLPKRADRQDIWAGAVWLGTGIVLAVIAVLLFRPRPGVELRLQQDVERRVANAHLATFAGLAFVLSIKDVSSFVLLVPAMHDVVAVPGPIVAKGLIATLVFALALLPVISPPLIRQILGHRADAFMRRAYNLIMGNQLRIAGVVAAVFSVYCVLTGIGAAGLGWIG